MLRDKKSTYFENQLELANGDSKHTLKILISMLKGKLDTNIKNVEIDGIKESVPEIIADKMNKFFVNSVKEINTSIPETTIQYQQEISTKQFSFKEVSMEGVEKYLASMKKKSDVNFINTQIILYSITIIGDVLLQQTNELMEGIVPDIYTILTVNPAPKVPRPKIAEEF